MPASVLRIRVLFSAPQDVEERDIARRIVEEINRERGDRDGFALQYLDRRTSTFPALGTPQEVAAEQIGEYDVYVGVFWNQFDPAEGEPPVTTRGEFERALETYESEGRPHVLFYFCQRASKLETLNALDEKRKVVQFRLDYAERAGLAETYEKADHFRERLRFGLTRTIDLILDAHRGHVHEPSVPVTSESIQGFLKQALADLVEDFDGFADLRPGATLMADPTDGGRGIKVTLTVEGRARNRCRVVARYRQGRGTMNFSASAGGSTFAQVEVVTGGGRLDFRAVDENPDRPDGRFDTSRLASYFWGLLVAPLDAPSPPSTPSLRSTRPVRA
jgi:hypothetical protein